MWGGWEGVGLVEGVGGRKYLRRFGPLGGGGFLVSCLLRSDSAGFSVVALNVTVDEGGEGGIRGLGATFGRGVSEQHAPPFP